MDDDLYALGLPVVTTATVEKYIDRCESESFLVDTINRIEAENPELFKAVWEGNYGTEGERSAATVSLMRVYALLALQLESDRKLPKN